MTEPITYAYYREYLGIVCTRDERYVFMLGGYMENDEDEDNDQHDQDEDGEEDATDMITILDVIQKSFSISTSHRCPCRGMLQAVMMGDEYLDEIVVFGYITLRPVNMAIITKFYILCVVQSKFGLH